MNIITAIETKKESQIYQNSNLFEYSSIKKYCMNIEIIKYAYIIFSEIKTEY